MKSILLFGILLITFSISNAQSTEYRTVKDTTIVDNYNHFYVALNGGLHQFYGDVSSDVFFPGSSMKGKIPLSISPKIGWDFNQDFGLRADFNIGSIWAKGNKPNQDIYFHANINDIQAYFIMNMSNIVFPYVYNKRWNLTFFAGAGWMMYRTIARNSNDDIKYVVGYDLNGNKTKKQVERLWSAGISGAYKIAKHLDVTMEVKFNNTPTDKLDGVDIVLSELDNYSSVTLGLNYYFGSKQQEWKWNPIDPFIEKMLDTIKSNENNLVDLGNKVTSLQDCCDAKNDVNQPDDDLDSVPNAKDLEPNTPKGQLVNFQGITIPQLDTMLSQNAGNIGNIGANTAAGPMFFNSIYFPFDQSIIDRENYLEIVRLSQYMKAHPGVKIMISGNCDKRGNDAYNDALSKRRVAAAKKALISDFGFTNKDFAEEALGKRKIFSQNTHWVNRRVDFYIVK